MENSKGHIAWVGDTEYYEYHGQVFKAPKHNVIDITTGCRIGRWECSRECFERYRKSVYHFIDNPLVVDGKQVTPRTIL